MSDNAEKNKVKFKKTSEQEGTIHLHKGDTPKPVTLALLIDATGSREDTIEEANNALKSRLKDLYETLETLEKTGEVQIVLGTYGENSTKFYGTFKLDELPNALDQIKCALGMTNIADTLTTLNQEFSDLDAVIVFGDKAEVSHFYDDTKEALKDIGTKMNAPIITLLDKTKDHKSSSGIFDGTEQEDIRRMRALSRASGVNGCPIIYQGAKFEYDLVDQLAPVIIAAAGPEALEEAVEKGVIKENQAGITLKTLKDIAAGGNKKRASFLRRHWKTIAVGGLLAAIIASNFLGRCKGPQTPTNDNTPETGNNLVKLSEFSTIGGFSYDDCKVPQNDNLEMIARYMHQNPAAVLVISGYTDEVGSNKFNETLGQQRAEAIKDALIRKDIPSNRLVVQSCGEADQQEAPKQSRRVQVFAL